MASTTAAADSTHARAGPKVRCRRFLRCANVHAVEDVSFAIAKGRPLGDGYADFSAAFHEETGRETALSNEAFIEATAPETFIARRDRVGGPAPAPLADALKKYRRDTDAILTQYRRRISRISEAETARETVFSNLRER